MIEIIFPAACGDATIEGMNSTPQSLLLRLCAPDAQKDAVEQAAWIRFVDLYTPLLHRCASRLVEQEADALDLVQEVFLQLHQKLPEFRYDQSQSFRGWLRSVLYNKWRDRQRRTAPPVPVDPETLQEVVTSDPWPEFAEADYQRYLVRRALELMQTDFEPTTWRAFWETTVRGRPGPEVAKELKMSLAALYKAMSRVRQALRRELEGLMA
jgi:RNA polymerase sigma-70 factor (ECF subfamily)